MTSQDSELTLKGYYSMPHHQTVTVAGKITHIFPKVKVDEHYDEVLEALGE